MVDNVITTPTTATVTYRVTSQNHAWVAYGILSEDGGLSYQTYESVEAARQDRLFRRGARVVVLRIENRGEMLCYVESEAEKFSRTLHEKVDRIGV